MSSPDVTNYIYLNNTSLGASFNGNPIVLRNTKGFSLCVFVTGTPTGTLKVQVSDQPDANPQGTDVTRWVDLGGSSTALAGAPINIILNIDPENYMWARMVYTRTGSTGNVTADFCSKG